MVMKGVYQDMNAFREKAEIRRGAPLLVLQASWRSRSTLLEAGANGFCDIVQLVAPEVASEVCRGDISLEEWQRAPLALPETQHLSTTDTWLVLEKESCPESERKIPRCIGAITEISDEYGYSYIRRAKDFVIRKRHSFPVKNRRYWEEKIRWRYNPDDPERFPLDFEERCASVQGRDDPLQLMINGPFWQMREWCDFEGLCLHMVEDPEFVEDMARSGRISC